MTCSYSHFAIRSIKSTANNNCKTAHTSLSVDNSFIAVCFVCHYYCILHFSLHVAHFTSLYFILVHFHYNYIKKEDKVEKKHKSAVGKYQKGTTQPITCQSTFMQSTLLTVLFISRLSVSLVFGIPTIRREKMSYLLDTLASLLDGMSQESKDDSVIVVFIGEVKLVHDQVQNTLQKIYLLSFTAISQMAGV